MDLKATFEHIKEHLKDGGFKSRKFVLALAAMALVFLGGILAGKWSLFGTHYEMMVSGILGIVGLYYGANAGSRWVAGKHAVAVAGLSGAAPPEASPEPEPLPTLVKPAPAPKK